MNRGLRKRMPAILLAVLLMVVQFAVVSFAAETQTRTRISSVTLNVEVTEWEDSDPDIEVSAPRGHYGVSDISQQKNSGGYYLVKVELEAEDEYYFAALSNTKVNLTGDKATFVSCTLASNKTIANVTLRVGNSSPEKKPDNNNSSWNWDFNWNSGGSSSGSKTSGNHIHYYNGTKIATYESEAEVKKLEEKKQETPVDKNGKPQPADEKTAKKNNTNTVRPSGWQLDGKGWYYIKDDGTYPTNGWLMIDNKWYCFDVQGYMRTGWIQIGEHWYYCDESNGSNRGMLLTNTRTPDGYYVNEKGLYIPGM